MSDRSALNPTSSRLLLKFISGKHQGQGIFIEDGQSVDVGRAAELGLVLAEDLVSRLHARFRMSEATLSVEDLGSSNGTFVNGEKIHEARLLEGDRVLIGANILKVLSPDCVDEDVTVRDDMPLQLLTPSRQAARRMSGSIEEIPLPDLLQLFSTSKKSGVLVLRTDSGVGRIYLGNGRIQHAVIEGFSGHPPLKAICRMLDWNQGHFELGPPRDEDLDSPLNGDVQEYLMESFRQRDELSQLAVRLPSLSAALSLPHPLGPPLRALDQKQLDLLQLAWNSKDIETVLQTSVTTDLETAECLIELLERGYLSSEQ